MVQDYYLCYSNSLPDEIYRVNKKSYGDLTTLPYFTKRSTCKIQQVPHQVCHCPAGFVGSRCQFADYRKCYVNMTEPALYAGCQGKFEDSEFYDYTIQGFDPCFFYDFE